MALPGATPGTTCSRTCVLCGAWLRDKCFSREVDALWNEARSPIFETETPTAPNVFGASPMHQRNRDIMMQMPMIRLSSAAAAALVVSMIAGVPAVAQQPPGIQQVDTPQRRAMQQCVSRVLANLARAKANYRDVTPTVTQQCDSQLRAVLASEIQAGRAGPCTNVEGCIDMARNEAGQRATLEYQRQSIR